MNWSKKHIKSYAYIMHWYMKGTGEMYIGTVQESEERQVIMWIMN